MSTFYKTIVFGSALGLSFFGGSVSAEVPPVEQGAYLLFVDAVRGEDSNDGLSEKAPLRSLDAAQKILDAVDGEQRVVLHLARGSVWREDIEAVDARTYASSIAFGRGRPNLTIRAYGEGDKPTISGMDILSSDEFQQHDAANHPNVWSQTVTPPPLSYDPERIGVIVNGSKPLRNFRLPFTLDKGTPHERVTAQPDIETEEDALKAVNETPDSYYAKDNGNGTYTYFVHGTSHPRTGGATYEYKVRGSLIPVRPWNRWENIRFIGLNQRNGIASGNAPNWISWEGVEVLYGSTHNKLIVGYEFEDCLSVGYPENGDDAAAASAYHAHHPKIDAVYGVLYDRTTARDFKGNAFYDHAKNGRPWVYVRDCVTENTRDVLSHGPEDSDQGFVIGHRHQGGRMGYLVFGRPNFIEDSIFRVGGRGAWGAITPQLKMRNSVVHANASDNVLSFQDMEGIEYEYDHCTLILDFEGEGIGGRNRIGQTIGKTGGVWKFRNSIIAVINAPDMEVAEGGDDALTMRFDRLPVDLVLENCVLTYIRDVPESAGTLGDEFVFVRPDEIFAGNPAEGDYRIRPGSEAEKRDVGYREGREPVYRPIADALAAELPRYQDWAPTGGPADGPHRQ